MKQINSYRSNKFKKTSSYDNTGIYKFKYNFNKLYNGKTNKNFELDTMSTSLKLNYKNVFQTRILLDMF